jgi:protein-S-isoprenylcysteine O-methyltransferase Ste14
VIHWRPLLARPPPTSNAPLGHHLPLYWFVLHPNAKAWERHKRAVYVSAALLAWGLGAVFLFLTRRALYAPIAPPPRTLTGCVLILAELYLFGRAAKDLGYRRLVGEAELSGGGEIMNGGIYGRIRNPRYTGSFLAIIGACLIAGTRWMWLTAAIWAALMFAAILLEKREMRGRFGAGYIDYCRRVPRFVAAFPSPLLRRSGGIRPDDRP